MVSADCLIQVSADCDFTIHNIPFGVFKRGDGPRRPCSAIGDFVIDLLEVAKAGLFKGSILEERACVVFDNPTLNAFMELGRPFWRACRETIQAVLRSNGPLGDAKLRETILIPLSGVELVLPMEIGDYTDFYSSKEHATNVGIMFRGKDNALQPNYLHLPVGYHGRSSSVVISGTPIVRPCGQIKPPDGGPVFGSTRKLDFELEMAFVVGRGNKLGEPIPVHEADEHIFGIVLMNDWSARDIQAWEYVPLGPFLGKNFGTIISPWIITLDALEPFKVMAPPQDPTPLEYLMDKERVAYDVKLQVAIKEPSGKEATVVCRSNLKYLYWNFRQQLAHHTINGCNMRSGDLCGTGTISGVSPDSFGSMLELSWNGQKEVTLNSGNTRRFIEDNDMGLVNAFVPSCRQDFPNNPCRALCANQDNFKGSNFKTIFNSGLLDPAVSLAKLNPGLTTRVALTGGRRKLKGGSSGMAGGECSDALKDYKTQKSTVAPVSTTDLLPQHRKDEVRPIEQAFSSFRFDETVAATFHGRKETQLRYWLFITGSMLSLGFVYLLSRWLPRARARLTTTVGPLAAATHVLIVNSFGQVELVPVERQRVPRTSRIFARYVDSSTMQVVSFDYRRNRFVLDPITGLFVPVENLLELCMPTEDDYFEGLERERAEEAKLFLGSNEILIEERSGLQIFCNEILHPFYVFQVASFFIWLYENYAMYAIVILIMATSSATLTVIETKRNLDKMREMARYACLVKAYRDGKISSMSSVDLVPGDVLVLDDQLDILPCDGVIISGDAIVDESMLTGETVPVTKASITYESYNSVKAGEFLDPKCAVFSGTRLLRCRSHHGRPPMVLVTRTGFLTTKGSLVQSILFPRPNNFRFYRDSMLFIGILGVIAFLGFSVAVVNFIALGVGIYWIISRALDVITVVVPPALPATMAIGTVFAINRLESRQIYCISPPRINIASKVQTICFDKTGTLTEEGLEIFGVISVAKDAVSAGPRLAPITERIDEVSHSDFVRLMATCHGLRKINGRLLGDSLDLRMFEFAGWEIEEFTDVGEAIVPTIVRPRGSPSFNIRSVDATCGEASSPFGETGIIRQFDFDSKLRRMSVIARTLSEESLYVFCKGSPESLFEICRPESLPTNYTEAFASYAHHGYRVIACAYKSCSSLSWVKAQKLTRADAESELIFLGFIIFENKLKPQSIPTISALKRASITNIMATGDNILTAISVGRACGLIEEQALVYYPSSFADATSSRDICWQCVDDVELPFDSVKLRPAYKEFHEKKKYCLAITGDFFEWMNDHLPKEYCHSLQAHCFIYARMSPHQKQLLVETLQQRSLIVGFCGDGANDCGALKAADVGVSLSQAEASIAAPFTSKIQDISCIPVLLKEGRASLVTSFCCFKYMTLYSMIQFTTLIFLYSFGSTLSDGQFIYVDLLLIVPLGILMSRYAPSQSLVAKQPTAKLISPSILSCIFGHIFIQAVAQAAVYFWLARPLASGWKSPIDDESNTLHPSTSVMFLFSAFLYILTALMFSAGRPFRERVYWPFIIYAVIGLTTTTLITLVQIEWVEEYLYLASVPLFTRVAVTFAGLTYGAVALCYDRLISPPIARAVQRRL